MQLPRRSVRSIQELPSIYTAFPAHYRPVRTHSASTASDSARSPDIEDGLEVVPLEHDSVRSAPIVSAYLDEKEVFINAQEVLEKPLPNIPTSVWARTWGRMSVKYRVLVVLGLQALVLLTVGTVLLTTKSKTAAYEVFLQVKRKLMCASATTLTFEQRETTAQQQTQFHPLSAVHSLSRFSSLNSRALRALREQMSPEPGSAHSTRCCNLASCHRWATMESQLWSRWGSHRSRTGVFTAASRHQKSDQRL